MNVIHDSSGHLVLIQNFGGPLQLPADLAGPTPLGPSAPAVNGVRRIPVPRSMHESYYLPRDIEEAHGMVSFAPASAQYIPARLGEIPDKQG